MSILILILQIFLALYNIAGGIFTINNYQQIASQWASTLPQMFWTIFGVVQILFAIGIVIPMKNGSFRNVNSVSALGLAIISLGGIALSAPYQGFPGMLWGIIPAILAGFIAYVKWSKR